MDTEDMMTITEAASHLKVARASVYDAIRSGRIRSEMVLGRQVVYKSDVLSYQPRAYSGKRNNERPAGVRGPGGRPRKLLNSTTGDNKIKSVDGKEEMP